MKPTLNHPSALSGVELVDPEGLDTTWFPVSSLQEMGQEGIF